MSKLDEYVPQRAALSASDQAPQQTGRRRAQSLARPADDARVLLGFWFAVYLALLCWIILWKLDIPYIGSGNLRAIKLVPFAATATYGASAPLEVIANLLLFVPFGLYLGMLAPRWSWWKVAGVAAVASLGLEVTQYLLALGSSDITDVIVNTAGALVGLVVIAVIRLWRGERTREVVTRHCVAGTLIALLVCGLLFASSIQFGAQDLGYGLSDIG